MKPIFGFQLQGMSVLVVVLRFATPVILAVALAVFFYTIASSPTRVASRLGLRGLKRQRALAKSEAWAAIEPLVRWLGVRMSGIPSDEQRAAIDEQIGLAGDYMGLTADEFLALSLLSSIGGFGVGILLGVVFDLGGIMIIVGTLAGAAMPYMQVSGVAQDRLKQVSRGLPYFIDVMALCMGAGLDFPGAIRKVVEQSSNPDDPLVEEFTLILQTLNLGRTRKEALLEFAKRAPVDAAIEFVNSLIQAEERGNPVAEVLSIQATISRQRRSVRAEELAAKAGVKMVGPLMLVFFCVMGLILGPAMMNIRGACETVQRNFSVRILRFQIRLPTGQVDQLNVESERVLIGSGAHCEIRLPLDQARVEHILIELAPQGVFARALNFEPPPTINNIAFTQAPLPPEAVLGVGQTQIFVMAADAAGAGALVQTKQKKSSPLTLLALFVMLAVGGYFLLVDDDSGGGIGKPKEPPDLWGPPVAQCPQVGPPALAFARDRLNIADAKRERRPFHVQDGVQSVPLYELAAACFRAGGDPATAAAADDTAQRLRKDINDDYRTQRVRLEHDLDVEDWSGADHQVRVLRQYTEGKQGDYVTWLTVVDRKLKAKVGRTTKP